MNRILLIEDEVDLYDALVESLRLKGYELVKEDYDVVVLDYGSKDYRQFDKDKLIIISGSNLILDNYRFLMKPFSIFELIRMIEEIQKT